MKSLPPPPSPPSVLVDISPPAGTARRPLPSRRQRPVCRTRASVPDRHRAEADAGRRERERLAQILHDHLGGLLVQLRLAYGAWRQAQPAAGLGDLGPRFDALLAELSAAVRTLTTALSPPEWHDELASALNSVVAELGLRSGLQVQLEHGGVAAQGLEAAPASLRAVVCRAVRELGLNVLKHAQASHLDIRVDVVHGRLCICMTDDGVGIPAPDAGRPADGLGLRSVRAQLRALGGGLVLASTPGQGTSATVTVPLGPPAPAF